MEPLSETELEELAKNGWLPDRAEYEKRQGQNA